MPQVEQIGYKTSLFDIKRMVKEDFGQYIDNHICHAIFYGNNLGQLTWTKKKIAWQQLLIITKKKVTFNKEKVNKVMVFEREV